jgi:hypothetical protein
MNYPAYDTSKCNESFDRLCVRVVCAFADVLAASVSAK